MIPSLQVANHTTMEEAYATASLAISRLASGAEEDVRHLESEATLRSVLHRRPVVLGFVVSTFAKRLQEGERAKRTPTRERTAVGVNGKARWPFLDRRVAYAEAAVVCSGISFALGCVLASCKVLTVPL